MPNPYTFPNCIGLYQAGVGVYSDAGTTAANSGDGVYQWNDQSGANNHLLQTTAANRPIYNAYTSSVPAGGPATEAPYGGAISLYQPSMSKSVLFDGSTSFLNMPGGVALPNTGCTVVMCTRGSYYCPVSFGTDGTYSINYGWVGQTPQKMAVNNGGARAFPASTYLPQLTPLVHGFRASAALNETRFYGGTNQTSALPANYCNFAMTGGAVGRTLNVNVGGYGNFSFGGEIYELAIFSSPLTNAMMTTLLSQMQTNNRLRADSNTNQVVFVGDSLTAGGPGIVPMSHCYPWVLCQQFGNSFKPLLIATPGHTIAQQQALVTNQVVSLDLTPFNVNVAVVCAGSNDLNTGTTAASVLTALSTLCTGLRTAGFKVVVCTITLRTNGVGATNIATDTAFNTVNAGLRSGYAAFADSLVDWAADPRLIDPTNAAYFIDTCHTTEAGDAVKASLVKAALDPILAPPAIATPVLNYASFYSGGRTYLGTFGNFVRS